jgi:hypothetical protein
MLHRLRTCTTTQIRLRWGRAKARFRLVRKLGMRLRHVVTSVGAREWDSEPRADDRSGKSIVYDTVSAMGWRPDVTHHPIRTVITKVIEDEREWEDGRQVPAARREEDCFVRRQAPGILVTALTWTASRTARSGNTTTLASLSTSFTSRYVPFMTLRSHLSSLYIHHLHIPLKRRCPNSRQPCFAASTSVLTLFLSSTLLHTSCSREHSYRETSLWA